MAQNLVDEGAVLAHPAKAFVLRHIPVPDYYLGSAWERHVSTYWSQSTTDDLPDDLTLTDYLVRLQSACETLFGPVDLDLHRARTYPPEGLPFHRDLEEFDDEDDLVRMVTCVHNATDEDRPLHFRRPLWTNHTETFMLNVPAGKILAFGGDLITDYEHGIPPGPDITEYRSIITRFATWS